MSDSFPVKGSLNVDTVGDYLADGLKKISQAESQVVFDLSGSEFDGTAGIALLIAWIRQGEKEGKHIQFTSWPENLPVIAKACGVLEMLDIAADAE